MVIPRGRRILLGGQFFVLMPVLLIFYSIKLGVIESDVGSYLYRSLRTREFEDATLIAVGISLHSIAHLTLETLTSFRVPKRHMLIRWVTNLAYAIANIMTWILLRFDSMNGHRYLVLQFLLLSVIFCCHCCSLNIICEKVWDHWTCLAVSTSVSLYFALSYQDSYVLNLGSSIGLLAFAFMTAGALLVIKTSYNWYKMYLYKKAFNELEQNEKICFARICAMLAPFLGIYVTFACFRNSRLEDVGGSYITTVSSGISTFIIIFSISYARKWNTEASEVAVWLLS